MTDVHAERRAALLVGALAAPVVALAVLVGVGSAALSGLDRSAVFAARDTVPEWPWLHVLQLTATAGQPRVLDAAMLLVAAAFAVRHDWRTALWVVAGMAVTTGCYLALKQGLQRPRPAVADQVPGWSFPSGHASTAAAAVLLLALVALPRLRRRWRPVAAALLALVGLAIGADRVFLAAHYPSDVVAGWLLGSAVVLLVGLAVGRVVLVAPSARTARALSSLPERRRSLAVVLNPIRLDSDAFRVRVGQVARAAGWDEPLWFETTAEDSGASMARAAAAAGAEVVAAAGGDGTVRSVCGALAGTGVSVGIVPAGTGNLLARNLGLPLDHDAALDVVVQGQDRAIDLVQIKGDDLESTRFAVMAGMGLDAAIMGAAPEVLKRTFGWPSYFVAGFQHLRYPAMKVQVSVDGAPPVTRRARTVVIGNVGVLTAGIPLIPDARLDDGVLDVVVVAPRRLLGWLTVLLRVMARYRRTDDRLDRFTGRSVVIAAERAVPRQLDGDPMTPGKELRADVEPGVLLVRVPR
ncbi:MAG TPA: diacylglycerol kinase family protein [Nocardioidaceae bacterium]|nr:diacylglycerol kinase family protein [Nocardioidaceae bacterium]